MLRAGSEALRFPQPSTYHLQPLTYHLQSSTFNIPLTNSQLPPFTYKFFSNLLGWFFFFFQPITYSLQGTILLFPWSLPEPPWFPGLISLAYTHAYLLYIFPVGGTRP